MARPTLSTHPKFLKLANRIKGRAIARGVLELIWESCYASGDARVGDAEAVEAIADWRGKAGALVALLVECGFLDRRDGDVFEVHDLEDHAPDYVLRRWEQEAKRREAGETIRSLRQKAAKIRWKQARQDAAREDAGNSGDINAGGMQTDASVERLHPDAVHVDSKSIASVTPPAPAPAPAPAREDPPRAPHPDPLSPSGLIALIRTAVGDAHNELGMYNPGQWAGKAAREFCDAIPERQRNDVTRAEIKRRIAAFAASTDKRITKGKWLVEDFCEAYNELAEQGPRRDPVIAAAAARTSSRPYLPPEKGVASGS